MSDKVYVGYKDTKGVKFDGVEGMVASTGKQIEVAGVIYPSCGSAAGWVVEQEALVGVTRNKETISKELRRYLRGSRSAWEMYGKYKVGS